MNGSAPNCSKTGSQTRVTKKCNPNLCRAKAEPCHSSKISSSVTTTTDAANKNVISRAISSPSRSRLRNGRSCSHYFREPSEPRRLLDAAQRLLFFGDYFFRQLRVRQLLRIVLPVRHHPRQKALDRIPLRRVRKLLRNQQPRKTRDRISRLARRIGNRDPEIVRHRLCRGRSSGADAR